MKKLIYEIHRRSLWQVLGIYLAASWVALEVTAQLAGTLALPQWVEPFALVLLVIGFPIVMATAFVQEKESAGAPDDEPAAAATTVPEAVDSPPPPAAEASPQRLLTWRNALVGIGLAFLLLSVVTTGFMFMRNRGIGPVGSLVAKGMLEEQAPIVLAQFEASDPSIGSAATEALRIDLSQSNPTSWCWSIRHLWRTHWPAWNAVRGSL
jgi:hypothetical protein